MSSDEKYYIIAYAWRSKDGWNFANATIDMNPIDWISDISKYVLLNSWEISEEDYYFYRYKIN